MELTKQRKLLGVKMNLLEEELSAVNSHVNKILQQGKEWLDGTNKDAEGRILSFKEISRLIEDTAMLMAEKYAELTDNIDERDHITKTTEAVIATSSSPVPVAVSQNSAESEVPTTAVTRIEEMEKAFSSLTAKVDRQQTDFDGLREMNKKLEDVAQKVAKQEKTAKKISKVEQKLQTVEELETQNAEKLEAVKKRLKNLEEETKNLGNFEAIEQKLDSLEEGESENAGKIEDFEHRLENLEKNETHSAQQFAGLEKSFESLKVNGNQNLEELAAMKKKMDQLEISSTSLSSIVENQESSQQNLTTTVEAHSALLESLTSNRETDDAKLRRVQGKVRVLEREKNKSLAKVGKQFEDVEFQYKMVCKIVADRLVPLERLRSILNERVKDSEENVQKLYTVIQDVAALLPRVSQLECRILKLTAGAVTGSALVGKSALGQRQILSRWTVCASSAAGNFDTRSGQFLAPLDGWYWVGLATRQQDEGTVEINVHKCLSHKNRNIHNDALVAGNWMQKHGSVDSDFSVVHMNAGDKLYVGTGSIERHPILSSCRFSVFLIK